ncbi:MAG TPA: energy transducer TonB [Chitinophagaceae bacterium]|nr:energy transducer TonB [Chitinophagaceae bacterium]
MELAQILSADVLDILFDERNKAYGAYDLRKNYQRRLIKALMIMALLVLFICFAYILLGSMKKTTSLVCVGPVVNLAALPPEPKTVLPPPPKAILPPPSVKTVPLTTPLIVKTEVDPDDMPPTVEELQESKIGLHRTDGANDNGIEAPPVAENTGLLVVPKKEEPDTRFIPIEVESTYPGGVAAWTTFLNRNLNYPQAAIDNRIEGTVLVQFIVDADGSVSNVAAISGPAELFASAVAVIKKSGKWTPALQNGSYVKSYKKQPISFKLLSEE